MKRILIILIAALLLAACGSKTNNDAVHEDVDKVFAEDTKRVLKELDVVFENEEPPSEKVIEITDRYLELYSDTEKNDLEDRIYSSTKNLISTTEGTDYLESDKEDYRYIRDAILSLIKTGKLQSR